MPRTGASCVGLQGELPISPENSIHRSRHSCTTIVGIVGWRRGVVGVARCSRILHSRRRRARAARVLHSLLDMIFDRAQSRGPWILGLILTTLFAVSCLHPPATLRELTYPPDFSYLPAEKLDSAMWVLAAEISRLDELLHQVPTASAAAAVQNQLAIQDTLRRLSAAVEKIDDPGRVTQHPALNRNLSRFRTRIERARRGAERTPPNYYQASALSGSCFLCHGSGDERTAL